MVGSTRRCGSFGTLLVPLVAALLLGACSRVSPGPPPAPPVEGWTEEGVASWYGNPFHGRTTASGETYDMEEMTAAHRTLPFGTLVRVENLETGRSTLLRINDRGPFVRGRILDVSRRGARELEMLQAGIAPVRLTVVEAPPGRDCWRVQVGAFEVRENALGLRARLEAEGYDAAVTDGPEASLRVKVGPLDSRDEADRLASRFDGLVLGCAG